MGHPVEVDKSSVMEDNGQNRDVPSCSFVSFVVIRFSLCLCDPVVKRTS